MFIHSIFGLEIIKRGVIFTDLAIGQIAAVGMALSIGFLGGEYQTLMTLGFALLGALMITYATRKVEHIEAFIGMLYAFGASGIMILLANSPEGAELFLKLSATDILFTTMDEVFFAAGTYILVALVMFLFYPRTTGVIRELTFFIMLALTVTSSVQLAGILVVFTLLVAPAFIALSQQKYIPILVAWGSGLSLCIIAIVVSYLFDIPTGYSIVFLQSLAVVLVVLLLPKR